MIASPNVAQSQSGPSLLGTWRLVSYEARDSEGRVQYPLGENVSGLLVYDGGGNMSAHVMRNDLPLLCTPGDAHSDAFTIFGRNTSGEYIARPAAGTFLHTLWLLRRSRRRYRR